MYTHRLHRAHRTACHDDATPHDVPPWRPMMIRTALVLLLCAAAPAEDIWWIADDGLFNERMNWRYTSLAGQYVYQVPGPYDSAVLTQAGGPRTISLTSDVTNRILYAGGGAYILDMADEYDDWTYTLTFGDEPLDMTSGSLTLRGGTLVTQGRCMPGRGSGTRADITVEDGARWRGDHEIYFGFQGSASLLVRDGAEVSSRGVWFGHEMGGAADLSVVGGGSTYTCRALYGASDVRLADGMLLIAAGGRIDGNGAHIGTTDTACNATITGTDSLWLCSPNGSTQSDFSLCNGRLDILAGGRLQGDGGSVAIGRAQGGSAEARVSGANSRLNNTVGTLFIGFEGTSGTLRAESLGQVSCLNSSIGHGAGDAGHVFIIGDGAAWTSTREWAVGAGGTGDFHLQGGADATSVKTWIGQASGATGEVEVTGPGSTWDNSDTAWIGLLGTGSLRIADGGEVTSLYLSAGSEPGGTGTVTIRDEGSSLTTTGNLEIGGRGTGTLTVEQQGRVHGATAALGRWGEGAGTAAISGAGAACDLTGHLTIGATGRGTLNVSGGATVTSVGGTLGHDATGIGTVDLAGDDSRWTSAGDTTVGSHGQGTINVNTGTGFESAQTHVGRYSGAKGTVKVIGPTADWTVTGGLHIGGDGEATVQVEGGATASASGWTRIAASKDSKGTVTLTGDGTIWTTANLNIGTGGRGKLFIQAGADVTSHEVRMGGPAQTGDQPPDDETPWPPVGVANVTGAGSTWTVTGNSFIGSDGKAELKVEQQGRVTFQEVSVEVARGSSITVTGLHSRLDVTGTGLDDYLRVGWPTGSGSVKVLDSAQIFTDQAEISGSGDDSGSVSVSGLNSKWWNHFTLTAGQGGKGNLSVKDYATVNTGHLVAGRYGTGGVSATIGSRITAGSVWLGFEGGSTGTIGLDVLSTLAIDNELYVGWQGAGTLTAKRGSHLATTGPVEIATGDASSGTVTIDGEESRWTDATDLYIGRAGDAFLNVQAGAEAECAMAMLAGADTATAGVTVTGEGETDGEPSQWSIATTLYASGDANWPGGPSTITVDAPARVAVGQKLQMWDPATIDLTGGGQMLVGAGTFPLPPGTLRIGTGGECYSMGTVHGTLVNAGYTTVGLGLETLLAGAFVQEPAGVLELEISPWGPDVLEVAGQAMLAGTLRITPATQYVPPMGSRFVVMRYGSVAGCVGTWAGLESVLPWGRYLRPLFYADRLEIVTLEPPLPGDVDFDNEVTVLDVIATVNAFSCAPGDDGWCPGADQDLDNQVSVMDVITVVNHFGTHR